MCAQACKYISFLGPLLHFVSSSTISHFIPSHPIQTYSQSLLSLSHSLFSLTMPAERVLKKVRLQEHHVAPQASPTTTADTATVITAAEQGSTGRTAFTPPTTITTSAPVSRLPRLGAQSNILRGHYKQTDLKDPLVFFSEEIALHILELLTPSELARCACVSTQWYRLVNDQMVSIFCQFLLTSNELKTNP